MSSLSFSAKESDQRKLPAAPASIIVSALGGPMIAEPDDAGLGGDGVASAFIGILFNYKSVIASDSVAIPD